jgi:hypothetical protein
VTHGLAAASLCLFAIGCGDDTGNDDGGDMGMRDMTVNEDMAVEDMTAPSPPSGAVIIADVVGVFYTPGVDGGAAGTVGSGGSEAFTHRIVTATNFPVAGGPPSDFSNLMVNAGTLTIGGCVADRYDTANPTAHHPSADVDVGTVTLGGLTGANPATGWESARYALKDAAGNVFTPPLPDSATCKRDATSMNYGCAFTGTLGGATAAGVPVSLGVFPAIPLATWTGTLGGMAADCDQTGHAGLCEQRLFYLTQTVDGGVGGTTIGVAVPGGAPYNASTKVVNIPAPVTIISIKQGTTTFCGTPAACAAGIGTVTSLDKTKDMTVSWSCDGSTTAGGGCSATGPFELVNMLGLTSIHEKGSFTGSDPQQGTLTCIEQVHKTDGTMTVPAAAWTAMIGSQTGGAITLNLLRVSAALAQLNPNQLYSAGTGSFVFLDLP